jgi:uncharacterized protein (TIGR03067 family)
MQVLAFAAFAIAVIASMSAAQDDKPAGDLRRLKGRWVAETREYQGKVEKKSELNGLTLVFDAEKFVITTEGDRVMLKGTITVDPTVSPKAIDVKVAGRDGKESVVPAIYELSGDKLKTAFPLEGTDQPSDFTTRAESKVRVTVYRRAKE